MTDTWVSPLVEVEQSVQARAKEVALDMAAPDGSARLRALVDEEVARWSDDYKRGQFPWGSVRTCDCTS
ncbi:MAG TPA: hypothetical protein VNA57_14240 [Acidimicrobiales bacterium]|nr:hypothetical protein [Acidimicrobiales bacterium]